MKIKQNEIIPKEHLFEDNFYFIKYQNHKLAIFKDGELHILDKKNNLKRIPYEQSQVFGWYDKSEQAKSFSDFSVEDVIEDYKKFSQELVGKRAQYTGAFIDENGKNLILSKISTPKNWRILCHHMTLNLGFIRKDYASFLNQDCELVINKVGIDKELGVMALGVETSIPSDNDIKHITLALKEGSQAYLSNKIEHWVDIEPFKVNAKVGEFLNNQTIFFGKEKINKLKIK